jgi:hypothetical protein
MSTESTETVDSVLIEPFDALLCLRVQCHYCHAAFSASKKRLLGALTEVVFSGIICSTDVE